MSVMKGTKRIIGNWGEGGGGLVGQKNLKKWKNQIS